MVVGNDLVKYRGERCPRDVRNGSKVQTKKERDINQRKALKEISQTTRTYIMP